MSDDEKEKELEDLAEIVNEEETLDEDEINDEDEIDDEEEIIEEEIIEEEPVEEEAAEETIDEEPVVEEETPKEEPIVEEKKRDKRKTAVIIIEVTVILMLIGLILYFFVLKEKPNKTNEVTEPTTKQIARPSSDIEYVPVKQSTFELVCNRTKDGQKIKTLKKGMIIECVFEFNTSQRVSELYFDLAESKNIKFSSYKNESGYTIESDGKTYKLTTYEPLTIMDKGINFYYEVTDESEKTGYIEIKDIIFKDDNNKYYKALNNMTTFPVEYDDKIYIYKATYDEDVYYYYRKTNTDMDDYDDEDSVLIDTFQCESEECDAVASVSNYFLIYDTQLIVYDPLKKTTRKIKLDDDIKIDDYEYELILGNKNNVLGVLFQEDYVNNYVCNNDSGCYENGLSGYKCGYYSFNTNSFTIALDYGWIGKPEYNEYDRVLLLQKDGKIGAFSYEDDDMMLTESEEYYSASYIDDLNAIALEVKNADGSYYYKYFDLDTKSFKLNTKRLQKFEDANIFYTTKTNRQSLGLTMLFNSKGESLKNLPYLVTSTIQSVTDKITTFADGYYKIYELDGTFVYTSSYTPDKIIDRVKIEDTVDSLIILDIDGKYALETGVNKYQAICDNTETNEYVKTIAYAEQDMVEVYVKDSSVTEEGMNGYKYVLTAGDNDTIVVTPELTYIN